MVFQNELEKIIMKIKIASKKISDLDIIIVNDKENISFSNDRKRRNIGLQSNEREYYTR